MLGLNNLSANTWGRWGQVGRKGNQIESQEESSMDYMHQDKPYIFSTYGNPKQGEVFVGSQGNVVKRSSYGRSSNTRMILKPQEVFHTFDGVKFKEGKMEASEKGRWYLFDGLAILGCGTGRMSRRLYPVSLA